MRAWRRGVCAAVACLALTWVTVPAGAEPEVTEGKLAPLAALWETVSDLWSGVAAIWTLDTEAAAPELVDPTTTSAAPCSLGCGKRGVAIDPNG